MARPNSGANLNIAQLEEILVERKAALQRLAKQKKDLLKKLDEIDRQIEKVNGSGAGGVRGIGLRPRNAKSLVEALADVLSSGKPMRVGDITEAVEAAGYRSSSDKFRAIVNQTLIKEKKRFTPTGERGEYQLKK